MHNRMAFGLGQVWILVLIGMLGGAAPSLACSCAWIDGWDTFARRTQFIFTGKAKTRTDAPPRIDSSGGVIFSTADLAAFDFEITEAIKGVQGTTLRILTERSSASCGASFYLDSTYLVFAYQAIGDSSVRTSLCHRNQKLGSDYSDSILTVVKAAVTSSAVRGAHARQSIRQNPEGIMQTLERRERRVDGRLHSRKPQSAHSASKPVNQSASKPMPSPQ